MPKLHSPCKFCDNRYLGCHKECEKYKDFQKKNEEQREGYSNSLIYEKYISHKRKKR